MPTSETLRNNLEAELADVEAKLVRITQHLRNEDRTVPQDWTEMATFLENDEVLEMLEVRTTDRVGEIKRALAQLDAGTYGSCASCGQVIAAERLQLLPSATTCARCARKSDPRQEGDKSAALVAHVRGGLGAVVDEVTKALAAQGFGVLTRIDVDQVFRKKLGLDWPAHVILGACNPQLAHQALSADKKNALLLPCNVTVEEGVNGCTVRILDPMEMLAPSGAAGGALNDVAHEARDRLQKVADALKN